MKCSIEYSIAADPLEDITFATVILPTGKSFIISKVSFVGFALDHITALKSNFVQDFDDFAENLKAKGRTVIKSAIEGQFLGTGQKGKRFGRSEHRPLASIVGSWPSAIDQLHATIEQGITLSIA